MSEPALDFGLADPCVYSRIVPDAVLTSTRALATATGADSIWLPDHLISVIPRSLFTPEHVAITRLVPSLDACYEPWTVLGRLSAQSRLSRLRLGVGCTDTARRNPAVTAQAAATLHQLTKGRAILGIGAGEGMDNAPYGVPWERPVATFEEGIAVIRALWDSGGEPISRDSPFFPLRDAVMAVPPYKGTRPELWIGAHGPRMRRAAGRYADVWFPGVTLDPHEYAEHLRGIRDVAADAGRAPHSVRGAKYFFVVTAHSEAVIEEILEAPAVRSYGLCAPSEYWLRHGAEHPLGHGFLGVHDLLPQTMDARTALSYTRQVPISLLRDFVLAGTPAEILEQLAEWRDQGMSYAVLLNMGLLQPSLLTGSRTMVSYTRLLRGIEKLRRRHRRAPSPHKPGRASLARSRAQVGSRLSVTPRLETHAQLRHVDPQERRGRLYFAMCRFATSKQGIWLAEKAARKCDPYLLLLTKGRLCTTGPVAAAVLETRGARTGRRRRTAMLYFHDCDKRVIIVAAGGGAPHHPAWFHNLREHPQVVFGGVPFHAEVVEDRDEIERLWALADRVFPQYADYRAWAGSSGREIPIVALQGQPVHAEHAPVDGGSSR
jgi:phthiodiolone/phenolphthiodiolone dimycocerosates ketoreductase